MFVAYAKPLPFGGSNGAGYPAAAFIHCVARTGPGGTMAAGSGAYASFVVNILNAVLNDAITARKALRKCNTR